MSSPMIMIIVAMIFMMLMSFFLRQSHVLSALMNLEVLTLFTILILSEISMWNNMYMIFSAIIIIIMSVCMACIGLCLLITMTRNNGTDMSLIKLNSKC